ncbi:hypothetical protein ACU4GH_32045 [Bradyrhizobium betae]
MIQPRSPQLVMATDIRWPPGVVMRRNGDCTTMARTASISSLSIGLTKPRSRTAPSAITSRAGCASATLSNRSAVNRSAHLAS